jgi:IclR family KDG regulon transcriptional repressor
MDSAVVKSVGRVFEVLESFARVRTPQTATEIGQRLNYPTSSTAAILKSMVTLGYLTFDRPTRSYFPTVRLSLLANWIDTAILGSTELETLIEELRVATGETVIIAAQNDLSVQYLLTRPGRFPVRFLAPAGMLRPLCRSGTGWALLSSKTDDAVTALVQRVNRSVPPGDAVAVRHLLDLLAEVRRQGYAASYGNVVADSGVVAMVLPTLPGNRTLVLGIGGPVERLQRNEASIAAIMQAAIQRHMGHSPQSVHE